VVKGDALPSVRFIRFAKLTVLIADIWTLAYVALVFGWQTFIFLRDGSWQALPLSFVFGTQRYPHGEVNSTGSIDKIRESQATNFVDALLQMPILNFCFWLRHSSPRFTYGFTTLKNDSLTPNADKFHKSIIVLPPTWLGRAVNPKAPAATRAADGTF
jgi:hypothetical protein